MCVEKCFFWYREHCFVLVENLLNTLQKGKRQQRRGWHTRSLQEMHCSWWVCGLNKFTAKTGEPDLNEMDKTEQAIILTATRLTESMFSSFLHPQQSYTFAFPLWQNADGWLAVQSANIRLAFQKTWVILKKLENPPKNTGKFALHLLHIKRHPEWQNRTNECNMN